MQELRNRLAHWILIINKSKPNSIVLRDPKKLKDFFVTDEVIKNLKSIKIVSVNFSLGKRIMYKS